MKVSIIGNLGYIGPVVVKHFRHLYPSATIYGYDLGIFAHCLTTQSFWPEINLDKQIFGDVRQKIDSDIFQETNVVIYLAAISNDPMGNEYEELTNQVNYEACIKAAKIAKLSGVKHFIFASSCSIYGVSGSDAKSETDPINPLTAYAKSKINAENGLSELADKNFLVTCLRFATACGASPRTRLDLVLNDFVAGAYLNKIIRIFSDGSPLRPLIHVADMARAIEWTSTRNVEQGDEFLLLNTGSNSWNYRVIDLANAVSEVLGDVSVEVNSSASPDRRSYRVCFDKFNELAPDHQPIYDLERTIIELYEMFDSIGFNDIIYHESDLIRLNVLKQYLNKYKDDVYE